MKVILSERELVGLWDFMKGPIWGNTTDTLLAQGELWDTFGFDERFARAPERVGDLAIDPIEFELSDGAVELLRSYLARPGQPWPLGLYSARALKRLSVHA
jgi:hypothetical protein